MLFCTRLELFANVCNLELNCLGKHMFGAVFVFGHGMIYWSFLTAKVVPSGETMQGTAYIIGTKMSFSCGSFISVDLFCFSAARAVS